MSTAEIIRKLRRRFRAKKFQDIQEELKDTTCLAQRKFRYILHLLSIQATMKSKPESLPWKEHFALSYSGVPGRKFFQSSTDHFIRLATKEILNRDIDKMRFFISLKLSPEASSRFKDAQLTIGLYYYIHN